MKGDYEDINPQYSQEIKDLVKSTLQKKSKDRPSSEEILSSPIFTKENRYVPVYCGHHIVVGYQSK